MNERTDGLKSVDWWHVSLILLVSIDFFFFFFLESWPDLILNLWPHLLGPEVLQGVVADNCEKLANIAASHLTVFPTRSSNAFSLL